MFDLTFFCRSLSRVDMMENGIGGGGGGAENGLNGDEDGGLASNLLPHSSEFQKVHSVLVDGGDRFGVSTVTVDLQEELIWMGNQGVRPIFPLEFRIST